MARLIGTDIIEKLEVRNFLFSFTPKNGGDRGLTWTDNVGLEGAI